MAHNLAAKKMLYNSKVWVCHTAAVFLSNLPGILFVFMNPDGIKITKTIIAQPEFINLKYALFFPLTFNEALLCLDI